MATVREAVIVEAVRTPLGRRDGQLKGWHPVDLLAFTLEALVERAGIDPALIDDVIAGLRQPGWRAGRQHRAQRRPGGRLPREACRGRRSTGSAAPASRRSISRRRA